MTQTLQAVGTGLAGGGVIFAAAALAAWLAPGLVKNAVNKTKNAIDNYFGEIDMTYFDNLEYIDFDNFERKGIAV